MSTRKVEALKIVASEKVCEEEFTIPLDISDIISICKEYSNLGLNIQNYMDNMLELGVEQSIKNGSVKQEYLVFIREFLKAIVENPYFGEATEQAQECISLIDKYQGNSEGKVVNLLLN